jgi:hypothetical protein
MSAVQSSDEAHAQEAVALVTSYAPEHSSAQSDYALGSRRTVKEGEPPMTDAVLPELSTDDTTAQLPSDPKELLSPAEHQELREDLAKLAQLRRDAETVSASLRLA